MSSPIPPTPYIRRPIPDVPDSASDVRPLKNWLGQEFLAVQRGEAALVSGINSNAIYINVKAFPFFAKGDGVTDDTVAIQAAINAAQLAGSPRGDVWFPVGTYLFTALTLPTNVWLIGAGVGATVLKCTGTGSAIANPSPGTRCFNVGLRDFNLITTTGAIGLDLADYSTGVFGNLGVSGFTVGIQLSAASSATGTIYNRFKNVTASGCGTGWLFAGPACNSNTCLGCRANVCTTYGVAFTGNANNNALLHWQIEGCGTGLYMTSAASNIQDNVVFATRFEGNTLAINIASANVSRTQLLWPYFVTNTTNLTDSGSATTYETSGFANTGSQFVSQVALANGSWIYKRTANAGSLTPNMRIVDSDSAAGSPVTLQIETERSGGVFLRGMRGGVVYFAADATGTLATYKGIATAGWGIPAIQGYQRETAQVAAVASVATYTVGAADGTFRVSANVNVTASVTHSFTVTVTYTDETNTSQVQTLPFVQLAGTPLTTITNVTGTGPYEGLGVHIRCKASTSITIATTGTFTSVTYNVEGVISQTA